jgi:hypothetical protein
MIIREVTTRPVEKSAIGKEIKFRIKASAKAFRLLSSTLYPDPIAAPLRELGTNAVDAQRMAGTTEIPFLVHLPNAMEPWVSIRDFGTGLSEKMIEDVYTVYFESPSAADEKAIGGYGLGSKTPFCYSDSFTVISYQDGKKFIYTAYLEQGEPCIAKFAEEDTDEHNGLEVSFAIKPEDFGKFIHTAQRVYSRFNVKPKIVGVGGFEWDKPAYLMTGTGWAIREDNRGSFAIMGGIEYPLNAYKMYDLDGKQQELLRTGLDIHFDIGEVQPSVSREELQYDKETVAAIQKKLNAASVEIREQVLERFKDCKTLWEARLYYHETLGGGTLHGYRIRSLVSGSGLKFNGMDVSDSSIYDTKLVQLGVNWTVYSARGVSTIRVRDNASIPVAATTKFFINDLDRGARARIRERLLNANRNESIVVIGPMNPERPKVHNAAVTITETHESLQKKLLETIGITDANISMVSSLPKPPKKTYSRQKGKTTMNVKVWRGQSRSYRVTYNWNDAEIDPKVGTHYYIPCEGFSPCSYQKKGTNLSGHSDVYIFDTLNYMKESLTAIKVTCPPVIRVLHDSKTIGKRTNWVNFYDFVKETLEAHLKNRDTTKIENASLYRNVQKIDNDEGALFKLRSKIKDKEVVEYLELVHELAKDHRFVEENYVRFNHSVTDFLNIVAKPPAPAKEDKANQKKFKDIVEKYPLITFLQIGSRVSLSDNVMVKELVSYINGKYAESE